jgi:hypothetical protein
MLFVKNQPTQVCNRFMKRIIIFTVALLIATSSSAHAQSQKSKNDNLAQEMLKLQRAQDEAEAKKDTAALERLFNDDFIFIAANGAVYDKKKFLDEIKGDTEPAQPQTLAYEDFKARAYEKMVIVNYILVVSGKDKDNKDYANRYRMSVVWITKKNTWRITNFHSTRVR